MPLPDMIQMAPVDGEISAQITVPGSKSITNRALILAALSTGETVLEGALWSEDTQVMVDCLRQLGFVVEVRPDPAEPGNRSITVQGRGGRIPRRGPLELFVGNAGTAARFLAALVCLGEGPYRLHGVPRMHERPQSELFGALRELGYQVTTENSNDRLPATFIGTGGAAVADERSCAVSIESSSQFASALILCARMAKWTVRVIGANADEAPYVNMTRGLVDCFPEAGGRYTIEADASSAAYFVAAGRLLEPPGSAADPRPQSISVKNWPSSQWQVDARFPEVLRRAMPPGLALVPARQRRRALSGARGGTISRQRDLGDSIMIAIVLAPLASEPVRFTDLGRLRVQECERVVALRAELTRCGARVEEEGDILTVYPSQLQAAEIETYNDHRMAMCFAILGLKVPGIRVKNPTCVKKTFPNFFQKLATPPPSGLGAVIRHGRTGRELSAEELFAD